MRLEDFDYELPPEQIAQEPATRRENSRLLVLQPGRAGMTHRVIRDLPDCLRPGDLLVINDTKVRPARLPGRKRSGGQVELLLLNAVSEGKEEVWSCLVRSSGRIGEGSEIELEGNLQGRIVRAPGEGSAVAQVALWKNGGEYPGETVEETLERVGQIPLPPYIRRAAEETRRASDRERYQTVFARHLGSAAAPTAGLHLTEPLLGELRFHGVEVASITLHVGWGTFQPIRTDRIEDHRMHAEWCRLPEATAQAMVATRRGGGRIVAVGTTVARTLEARWGEDGPVAGEGPVNLFIRPGYRFQAIDMLLTNFHVPRSSLLLLVAAFAGRDRVLAAYRSAVGLGYRFFSYGDAMLVSPRPAEDQQASE